MNTTPALYLFVHVTTILSAVTGKFHNNCPDAENGAEHKGRKTKYDDKDADCYLPPPQAVVEEAQVNGGRDDEGERRRAERPDERGEETKEGDEICNKRRREHQTCAPRIARPIKVVVRWTSEDELLRHVHHGDELQGVGEEHGYEESEFEERGFNAWRGEVLGENGTDVATVGEIAKQTKAAEKQGDEEESGDEETREARRSISHGFLDGKHLVIEGGEKCEVNRRSNDKKELNSSKVKLQLTKPMPS